jgi:hypothetical protein
MATPNEYTIRNFISDIRSNGLSYVRAALPRNECFQRKVAQIRTVKAVVAMGWDGLGNCTVLTTSGYVMQLSEQELNKMEKTATK